MKTIITFGTYDIFHEGHIKLLLRARKLGDRLIVGISTDQMSFEKKGRYPMYNQEVRKLIAENIKGVDLVFYEESMEKKKEYIEKYNADILVMGDDWIDKFDDMGVETVYLTRTPGISTSDILQYTKQ